MNSNLKKYTDVRLRVLQLPAAFRRLPEDVCNEFERRLNTSYFAQFRASRLQDLDPACIHTEIKRVTDVQVAYRVLEDSGLFGLCILLDKSGQKYCIENSLLLCVSLTQGLRPELKYVLCYEDTHIGD